MSKPAVLTSPEAFEQMKAGFDLLGDLLSLSLGPTGGVILSTTDYNEAPEPLSDAAVVARRMLELPNKGQNVGAMLMRNLVWRVHQRVGDGSALTAVLAKSLLDYGARCMAAGVNPVMIQKGIRRGTRAAIRALSEASHPIKDENDLAAIAQAVTMQTDLSVIIGEMFALLGEHGHVRVEKYMASYLDRTYLNGGLWEASLISPYLISAAATKKAILDEARVLICGDDLSDPADLAALFRLAKKEYEGTKKPFHLLLCARNVKDEALNTLVTAHTQSSAQKEPAFRLVGVDFKRPGDKFIADLEDLAVLTGATIIDSKRGKSLESLGLSDLGHAQRVEASAEELLVIGGKGDADKMRQQVQVLKGRLTAINQDGALHNKPGDRPLEELQMRLARLTGSAGILKVGAASQTERDVLFQKAEKGIKAVKAAMQEGIVPGGGAAYLSCIDAVESLTIEHREEAMGIQAVVQALQAPFLTILNNGGIENSKVLLEDLRSSEGRLVYDVLQEKIVPAREAGLQDATKILRIALETAASGAMLALSTAVIILKRKPKLSYEP